MSYIFFDIHTHPDEELTEAQEALKEEMLSDRRYKKAASILAYRKSPEYEAKRLTVAEFHPRFGRLDWWGMLRDDTEVATIHQVGENLAEQVALEAFWEQYRDITNHPPYQFVGCNCLTHSLPFIVNRSLLYGIDPPLRMRPPVTDHTIFLDLAVDWYGSVHQNLIALPTLATFFDVTLEESPLGHLQAIHDIFWHSKGRRKT